SRTLGQPASRSPCPYPGTTGGGGRAAGQAPGAATTGPTPPRPTQSEFDQLVAAAFYRPAYDQAPPAAPAFGPPSRWPARTPAAPAAPTAARPHRALQADPLPPLRA